MYYFSRLIALEQSFHFIFSLLFISFIFLFFSTTGKEQEFMPFLYVCTIPCNRGITSLAIACFGVRTFTKRTIFCGCGRLIDKRLSFEEVLNFMFTVIIMSFYRIGLLLLPIFRPLWIYLSMGAGDTCFRLTIPDSLYETCAKGIIVVEFIFTRQISEMSSAWWIQLPWFPARKFPRGNRVLPTSVAFNHYCITKSECILFCSLKLDLLWVVLL